MMGDRSFGYLANQPIFFRVVLRIQTPDLVRPEELHHGAGDHLTEGLIVVAELRCEMDDVERSALQVLFC